MSINIPTTLKANIEIPYGQLQSILNWCKQNCTSNWKFAEDNNSQFGGYEFFFESERDYVAFVLWKK